MVEGTAASYGGHINDMALKINYWPTLVSGQYSMSQGVKF